MIQSQLTVGMVLRHRKNKYVTDRVITGLGETTYLFKSRPRIATGVVSAGEFSDKYEELGNFEELVNNSLYAYEVHFKDTEGFFNTGIIFKTHENLPHGTRKPAYDRIAE